MRSPIIAFLSAVALVVAACAFLKQHLSHVLAVAPPATESVASAPVPVVTAEASQPAPPPAAMPSVQVHTMTPEEKQAAIDTETDRLQQWSMNDDPASLTNILADLTSPEKEIRDAAIEATKQFGSTNAIPVLKEVAANTSDTDEQIALLEAANFLSLPSLDLSASGPATPPTPEQIQQRQQQQAAHDANRLARQQRHAGAQNSQGPAGQNPPVGQ